MQLFNESDMRKIVYGLLLFALMGCRPSTLEWGKELLAEKNYEKAKEALSLWIQSDTTRWDAYYARAESNLALDLEQDALLDYEKAFAMHPTAQTCAGMGKGYLGKEDYEKAKANFNQAIGMDRGHAEAYLGLGNVYLQEEQWDESLLYLAQAKERWKDTLQEELSLAFMKVYFEKMEDEACLEQASLLKRAQFPPSEVYEYAGRVYTRQKRYAQAQKEFQKAYAMDPTNIFALALLADVFSKQEDFKTEIMLRTRIIRQAEEHPAKTELIGMSYFYRGVAKDHAGDIQGALEDLDKSISLSDEHAWAYFSRAVVKIERKDLSGALLDYLRAINLEPDVAFDEYLKEDPKSFSGFLAYAKKRGVTI